MRPNLIPSNVSSLLPFQPCTQEVLEKTDVIGINGNTSNDGNFSWLYHGPFLEVLTTKSRTRVATWKFGSVSKDSGTVITTVQEYQVNDITMLIVGLATYNTGMVCLFDFFKSCVVKTIEIPQKVMSLTTVLTVTGDQFPGWAICNNLKGFHGIVAVGVHSGRVYLIDMCTDRKYDYETEKTCSLQLITPRSRDVHFLRQQALIKGQVLAMLLSEECCSHGSFTFYRPDNSVVKKFKTDSVSVTCLQYVQQAGILCVGFSFGGFQLWKLYNPVMEYCSRLEPEPNAVSHFTYQEPENDPKNFSYLWVARDNSLIQPGQENISTVCLYQLCFGKKTIYSSYGVFYEELETVCLRLEYELLVDPFGGLSKQNTWMSQIVSCYTLVDPLYTPPAVLPENESFEEACHGPDLSLCVIVWEAQDSGPSDKSNYFLALFDINRWYHAQMPSTIKFGAVYKEICSYFAVYRLNDITDIALPDVMLNLHVQRNSVKRFINNTPLPPEQHFYPSALTFEAVCLMETGIITASFLGLQKQVLYEMRQKGAMCLLDPRDLYNTCVLLGLLPKHEIGPLASNVVVQRQCLLTMVLEYPMISFIVDCIEVWADGEFVHQGCTLKFILDWAWDQVSNTKRIIDESTKCLYDWSGKQVDSRLLHTLHRASSTFTNLLTILANLLHSAPSTEQGLLELTNKQRVLTLLSEQLQVVLWFIDAKLLPEDDDVVSDTSSLFCYPYCKLERIYDTRRSAIRQLQSEMKGTELLLIDGLVKCCGQELTAVWKREGGNGLYPPPSLHALLAVYLLLDVSLDKKHAVVLYMLFDIMLILPEKEQQHFSNKVAEFAKTFGILDLLKQISGFCLIDNQDFNEAFQKFFEPAQGREIGPWQHTRIIKSFLYHGEHKMALRYMTSKNVPILTPEQVKLKLTVLLANGLTTEAFSFQRSCRNRRNMTDLLSHLFLGCQQMKLLDQLLQLPLTDIEERHLVSFLSQNTESQEILVMHYLQRARYIEAIRLNEKLRLSAITEKNSMLRERAVTRNMIVDGYTRLLPESQRRLIKETPEIPTIHEQRIHVKRPRPLSTVVRKSEPSQVQSFSRLILSYMRKVHEIQSSEDESEERVETEKDLGPFLRTPVTPRKKSRLSHVSDVVCPSVKRSDEDVCDFGSPIRSKDIRKSKIRTADTLIMLSTPEVRRKSRGKSLVQPVQRTPHSILKVRKRTPKSPGSATGFHDLDVKMVSKEKLPEISTNVKQQQTSTESANKTPTHAIRTELTETPKMADSKTVEFSITDMKLASEAGGDGVIPKQLRFAEPEEGEVTPPVTPNKLNMTEITPPLSSKLLHDPSRTPESLTPKLISKTDSLVQIPVQPATESPLCVLADSDGEITFNFTKTQTVELEEAMEVVTHELPSQTSVTDDDDLTETFVIMDAMETRTDEEELPDTVPEKPSSTSLMDTLDIKTSESQLTVSEMSLPSSIDLSDFNVGDVEKFLLTPAGKFEQLEAEIEAEENLVKKDAKTSEGVEEKEKITLSKPVEDEREDAGLPSKEWKLEMASSDDQDESVSVRKPEKKKDLSEQRKDAVVVADEKAVEEHDDDDDDDVRDVEIGAGKQKETLMEVEVQELQPARLSPPNKSKMAETAALTVETSAVPMSKDVIDVVNHLVERSVSCVDSERRESRMKSVHAERKEEQTREREKAKTSSDEMSDATSNVPSTPPRKSKSVRARRNSTRKSSVSEDDNYLDSPARSTRSARRSMTPLSSKVSDGAIVTEKNETLTTPVSKRGRSRRASVSRKLMQASPAMAVVDDVVDAAEDTVQLTKLKDPLPPVAEETEATPSSPTRRSLRFTGNPLDTQQHSDQREEPVEADVVPRKTRSGTHSATPASPTRSTLRRKKKESESESSLSTPVKSTISSVPLTPPDSSHGTSDNTELEKQTRRKKKLSGSSKSRLSTSILLRSHDKPPSESIGRSSPSFSFSAPVNMESELCEKTENVGSPLKSFIFSPPITRQSSRRDSLGRTKQTVSQLSSPLLLTGGASDIPTSTHKPRGRPKKDHKQEITSDHEDESVILLTPYELRHPVTRPADYGNKTKTKVLLKKKKRVHRID